VSEAFGSEWGQVVAYLIRVTSDWDLAEDCAQDAFARALERWPRDAAGLGPAPAWAWWSRPSIAVFAVATLATAAAVIAERRAAEPIMPGWIWRRRALAGSGMASLGCGLLIIGPTAFLPTYGQVVLGLGAIGAGAVLAAMSFGWPLTSSQSARLFLRIGFRDTGLLSAIRPASAGKLWTVRWKSAWSGGQHYGVCGYLVDG
jgi:Sigma-70 region 2